MSRPTLEVADIVRAAGNRFWEHHGSHLAWQHRKVLDAIVRCRTAALGGHRDQCVRCGHQAISYNSCRNRHCPRCQGNARSRWLAERRAELLPVSYFHIVFTLPHELSALACRTSDCFTICCSERVQRRCSNSPATRNIWVRTSGFLACSTLGDRSSSAHTLHCSCWRSCTRRFPMDPLLETILSARRRAESRLPGQVRSRTEATLSSAQAPVPWLTPESC